MPGRSPIVVFDVETVPDRKHHDDDSFAKALFHQIVAISYLKADLTSDADGTAFFQVDMLKSGGDVSSDEQQLVTGFFRFIERSKPRLVTFNGRSFDLPVLRYRALKYGVSAPWYGQGESRWQNYGQRYSVEWHLDLMDALSEFGASKVVKLSEICELLGIPAKLGIDGSQVEDYYKQGRTEEIRNYCETDVLGTYLVFLKFALFRGELSEAGYQRSIVALKDYLAKEVPSRGYLEPFSSAV
jgi:predicted PolB exonuclease-like 3'-5' exonuclease